MPEKTWLKRLAPQVEDHDLEFGVFQGTMRNANMAWDE
jgi:hypothetical protein